MQALRMTQDITEDGFIHLRIPRSFVAKRVDLIILPAQDQQVDDAINTVIEEDVEWDVDYDAAESSTCQTRHNFERMDAEFGPEDMKQWK